MLTRFARRFKTTIVKPAAIRSSLDDPWATHKNSAEVRDLVRTVLGEIQVEGDVAVARYSKRFEDTKRSDNNFRLSEQEIEQAMRDTPKAVRDDISESQHNIRRFALQQRSTMHDLSWEDPEQPGVTLGHRHIPINRVGMYIPGGRYPHIAAASMQSVTARAAGVNSIVACTPTRADILDKDGNRMPHPYLISALKLGGVDDI